MRTFSRQGPRTPSGGQASQLVSGEEARESPQPPGPAPFTAGPPFSASAFQIHRFGADGGKSERNMVITPLCIQRLRLAQQMGKVVDHSPMHYLTEYQSDIVHQIHVAVNLS